MIDLFNIERALDWVKACWNADAQPDDDGLAVYWVGDWKIHDYPVESTLQLYVVNWNFWVKRRTQTGRRRHLGFIVNGALLTLRNEYENRHPRLDCYTFNRHVLLHADLYGFSKVVIQLPDSESIKTYTVDELLSMPEVPKHENGGYDRQVQISAE